MEHRHRALREEEWQLKVVLQGPQARESRDSNVRRKPREGVDGGNRRQWWSEVEARVEVGGSSGGGCCGYGGETGHVLPCNWAVVRAAVTIVEVDGGRGSGGGVGRGVKQRREGDRGR